MREGKLKAIMKLIGKKKRKGPLSQRTKKPLAKERIKIEKRVFILGILRLYFIKV